MNRKALVRLAFVRNTGIAPGLNVQQTFVGKSIPTEPVAPGSVLGQNISLRQGHDAEFKALQDTGFYTTP